MSQSSPLFIIIIRRRVDCCLPSMLRRRCTLLLFLAFMCKDPSKEAAVLLPKVETDSLVGMSMIVRFWDVKGNVVIMNYLRKRAASTNVSY